MELWNGDCLELMKNIPDGSVDMILCDLPYGTTACRWDSVIPFDALWSSYRRVRKAGAPVVLFGCEPFSSRLRLSNIGEYRYDWKWDKCRGYNFQQANFAPMRNYEDIMVFCEYPAIFSSGRPTCPYYPQKKDTHIKHVSGSPGTSSKNLHGWNWKPMKKEAHGFYPTAIISFPKDGTIHSTQKPVALLEYLIRTYTKEGEIVLDNTMGSGSTGVACVNTGRDFIGIELDKEYYDIACGRIAKAQKDKQEKLF